MNKYFSKLMMIFCLEIIGFRVIYFDNSLSLKVVLFDGFECGILFCNRIKYFL